MAVKMGHLFISYSHKDKAYAHKLARAFEARGFNAWIDDRIDYGTRWPKVIQDQLDTCDAFIVIVSENSYESDWVQSEVARAKRKGKPIFPLLLSGDTWLSVEATQYVDVKNGSLPPEDFYNSLRQAITKSDPQPSRTNPEPKESAKDPGRGCKIEIGQMLKVAVFFTVLVAVVVFSTWYTSQNPSSTPTPLQSEPTWTATTSPSATPPGTFTPAITSTPLVIVDTSNLIGWVPDFNRSNIDGGANRVDTIDNAIELTYDLGWDGYVLITKSVDAKELAGTKGIRFIYMGKGASNTFEFKLLLRYPGHTGDTTYGIVWNGATDTDGKWQEMKVLYTDMWCWGPGANCNDHPILDTAMVDRLDFAISNKPGDEVGQGRILIKDVFGIRP